MRRVGQEWVGGGGGGERTNGGDEMAEMKSPVNQHVEDYVIN